MKTEKFALEAITSRSVLSTVYTILLLGLLLVTLVINWIDIFTTEDSHAPINIPAKLWAPCFVSGVCLLLSYGFGTLIKLFGFDSSATTTAFAVTLRLSGITMCWSTLLSFSLVIFLQLEPDTAKCHAPLADCDRSKNLPLEACLCMLFAPTILYFVFPHIRWWIIVLQYISSVVVVAAAISTSRAATRHVLLIIAMIVFSAYSLWQTRGSAFGAPFVVNGGQEELSDFGAKLRCMISGIAHDLKSPLSALILGLETFDSMMKEADGFVKMQPSYEDLSEFSVQLLRDLQSVMMVMQSSKKSMLITINRCVDFNQASSGLALVPNMQVTDLFPMVDQLCDQVKEQYGHVKIYKEYDDSLFALPEIMTDQLWLEENLFSLLTNAIKYADEEEPVVMLYITQVTRNKREYIKFYVIDEGLGVDPGVEKTLFTFFGHSMQVHTGGSGLGLYTLACRIKALRGNYGFLPNAFKKYSEVEQHGFAALSTMVRDGPVLDKPAHGAVFWFEVPLKIAATHVDSGSGETSRNEQSQPHNKLVESARPSFLGLSFHSMTNRPSANSRPSSHRDAGDKSNPNSIRGKSTRSVFIAPGGSSLSGRVRINVDHKAKVEASVRRAEHSLRRVGSNVANIRRSGPDHHHGIPHTSPTKAIQQLKALPLFQPDHKPNDSITNVIKTPNPATDIITSPHSSTVPFQSVLDDTVLSPSDAAGSPSHPSHGHEGAGHVRDDHHRHGHAATIHHLPHSQPPSSNHSHHPHHHHHHPQHLHSQTHHHQSPSSAKSHHGGHNSSSGSVISPDTAAALHSMTSGPSVVIAATVTHHTNPHRLHKLQQLQAEYDAAEQALHHQGDDLDNRSVISGAQSISSVSKAADAYHNASSHSSESQRFRPVGLTILDTAASTSGASTSPAAVVVREVDKQPLTSEEMKSPTAPETDDGSLERKATLAAESRASDDTHRSSLTPHHASEAMVVGDQIGKELIPSKNNSSISKNVSRTTSSFQHPIAPTTTMTHSLPKEDLLRRLAVNILVVDDSLPIRKMCSMILQKQGYQVTSAVNGKEALKMMTAWFDHQSHALTSSSTATTPVKVDIVPYDVVLMDIQMPVMDGIEAVTLYRQAEREYNKKLQAKRASRVAQQKSRAAKAKMRPARTTNNNQAVSPAAHQLSAETDDGSDIEKGERRRPPTKTGADGDEDDYGGAVVADGLDDEDDEDFYLTIIAMSACSDFEIIEHALEIGMTCFMPKPFTIQQFRSVAKELGMDL